MTMSPVKLTDEELSEAFYHWADIARQGHLSYTESTAIDFWEYVGPIGGLHHDGTRFSFYYLVPPEVQVRVRALSGPYKVPIVKGWYVVNRKHKNK